MGQQEDWLRREQGVDLRKSTTFLLCFGLLALLRFA